MVRDGQAYTKAHSTYPIPIPSPSPLQAPQAIFLTTPSFSGYGVSRNKLPALVLLEHTTATTIVLLLRPIIVHGCPPLQCAFLFDLLPRPSLTLFLLPPLLSSLSLLIPQTDDDDKSPRLRRARLSFLYTNHANTFVFEARTLVSALSVL